MGCINTELLPFLVELINLTLSINRLEFFARADKIGFIDVTILTVCKVIRSSRYKTMFQFAQYSKSTMGW
jgi:Transposase DDE domain